MADTRSSPKDVRWLRRPLALTLAAWFLILTGASEAISILGKQAPDSEMAALRRTLLVLISLALYWGSAIGLLRGREWGRFLWIGGWGALVLVSAGRADLSLLMARVAYLAIWCLVLYRRDVSDYIATVATLDDPVLRQHVPR